MLCVHRRRARVGTYREVVQGLPIGAESPAYAFDTSARLFKLSDGTKFTISYRTEPSQQRVGGVLAGADPNSDLRNWINDGIPR